MARLKTKTALTSYIKSQLGSPTINVEPTTDQIGEIIDDAIQRFTEYAYGTLEATALLELSGIGDYTVPDTVTNIIKISQGATSNITNFSSNFGSGYVPDMWSEQFFSSSPTAEIMGGVIAISNTQAILDKYFGDDIIFNFNPWSKNLNIMQNVNGTVVIHFQYEYIANDANDLIFNHEWIKDYTKAKTKELWSIVTGKFDQSLVGGARINYDKMAQEAAADIEKLEGELLTKWSDPAPIDVS